MRHKWADLIHAWAEGAEIEMYWSSRGQWEINKNPSFSDVLEYRIKPTPKPDTKLYGFVYKKMNGAPCHFTGDKLDQDNLELTFDGETGELKSAEVLK